MKTLKPIILTFLIATSIITFAFMKPNKVMNLNYNFGINDTIDTLKLDFENDDWGNVMDDDLENSKQINNAVHNVTDSLNLKPRKK